MFHLDFTPINIPVYALLWKTYQAVWRWLWRDICKAWWDAFSRRRG